MRPIAGLLRGGMYRPCKAGDAFLGRTGSAVQNGTDTHGAICNHARRPVPSGRDVRAVDGKRRWKGSAAHRTRGSHRRRISHPPGETANPARTQHVQAPCNSGGNSSRKLHLRGRSTANAAGFAVSTRSTSGLPRSACGLRRPRAPRIRRAGTMMGARDDSFAGRRMNGRQPPPCRAA